MATFSMRAKSQGGNSGSGNGGGNFDPEKYNAWNKYQFEDCFKAKEVDRGNGKKRKQKTMVGVVNLIMDLGTPPANPNMWKVKEDHVPPAKGEEYSQYELDFMKANAGTDFVWADDWDANNKKITVRKQTSPQDPVQEFGFAIDFPSIMVDYSKAPWAAEGAEPDLRPYRISANGFMFGDRNKIGKHLQFEKNWKTNEVSDKNFIRKIAIAAGIDAELVESDFDIGTLAGAVCNFKVTFDLSEGDRVFLNDSLSTPSAIEDIELPDDSIYSAEAQKEKALSTEGLCDFTGILLNGMEYTDEMLAMVAGDKFKYIKRAELSKSYDKTVTAKDGKVHTFEDLGVEYATSDFKKALDKYLAKKEANKSEGGSEKKASKPTEKKAAPKPEPKPEPKKEPAPQSNNEPTYNDGMDFDDEIPF